MVDQETAIVLVVLALWVTFWGWITYGSEIETVSLRPTRKEKPNSMSIKRRYRYNFQTESLVEIGPRRVEPSLIAAVRALDEAEAQGLAETATEEQVVLPHLPDEVRDISSLIGEHILQEGYQYRPRSTYPASEVHNPNRGYL